MRFRNAIERLTLGGLVFTCLNISLGLAASPPITAAGTIQAVARVISPTGITDIADEDARTRRSCSEIIEPSPGRMDPGYFLLRAGSLNEIVVSLHSEETTSPLMSPDRVFPCQNSIRPGPGKDILLIKYDAFESGLQSPSGAVIFTVVRCDN